MAVTELASGVYAYVDGDLGVSVGLVKTSEGTVVIDTTVSPGDMESVLHQAGLEPGEVSLVINTHFHSDHTWGNQLFDCLILAHELCRQRMVENLSGPWSEAGRAAWIAEMGHGDPAWAEMARAVEPQPQANSSMAMAALMASTAAPPYFSGTSRPSKPSGPIFLTAGQLNSAFSSVSLAFGLTSLATKSWTRSRNILCSSFNSKSIVFS